MNHKNDDVLGTSHMSTEPELPDFIESMMDNPAVRRVQEKAMWVQFAASAISGSVTASSGSQYCDPNEIARRAGLIADALIREMNERHK